jgi:hypothetical protein
MAITGGYLQLFFLLFDSKIMFWCIAKYKKKIYYIEYCLELDTVNEKKNV